MKRVDEVKAKKAVLTSKRYDMLNKVFNESMVKPPKRYWCALNGKGYNGLKFKDAQRLMNMSCSEVAEKASLNTNPI